MLLYMLKDGGVEGKGTQRVSSGYYHLKELDYNVGT